MNKSKSRKENYLLAGCLFFILFLLTTGMLLVPGLLTQLEKSQRMIILQNQGVLTNGCVTDKDAHEGFRGLPEVSYSFQASYGTFVGKIGVTDQVFEQLQVGDCFKIIYLPEDPSINSAQTYVEAFNPLEYWSDYLEDIPLVIGVLAFVILLMIFNYFDRRRHYIRGRYL